MALKVSILVPIYGVEKFIERCAVSLFEQTYTDIEYVFVNDCTPDNSIEVLLGVVHKYPNRLKDVVIINHEKNKGLGEARNSAVSASTGDFIMHVDSDDYLDVNCVLDCVQTQMESCADVVAFDQIKIRNGYKLRETKPAFSSPKDMAVHIIRRDCPNGVCSNFIRRSLYTDNDIKVENGVSMGEDLIVLPRLLYYAKIVANQHSSCYYYDNTNEQSYTASFSEKKANQVWDVINYLDSFYADKEQEYHKALDVRRLRVAAEQIKTASIAGGYDAYIREKQIDVKKLAPTYSSYIDGALKFGITLDSIFLMRSYFKMASKAKSILNRIKQQIL